MQRTLFLIFSACILIFSIISLCTAPIINNVLTEASDWNTKNCKQKSDFYKNAKDNSGNSEEYLNYLKKDRNLCNRQKAMYGLEYSSLILDVTLGFICAILGLLHFFDVGKYFEKVSGIIGLATGIITFVLTLVYICYSGYIFTKDIAPSYDGNSINTLYKLNGEGAFAEKTSDGRYKCIYYKSDDEDAIYAKYNDLGKKQYNYQKKRSFPDSNSEYSNTNCIRSPSSCRNNEYISISGSSCKYLYQAARSGFENKYVYDRWVTTLIFSCFIVACSIGLAIFGFLLFKSSGNSGI